MAFRPKSKPTSKKVDPFPNGKARTGTKGSRKPAPSKPGPSQAGGPKPRPRPVTTPGFPVGGDNLHPPRSGRPAPNGPPPAPPTHRKPPMKPSPGPNPGRYPGTGIHPPNIHPPKRPVGAMGDDKPRAVPGGKTTTGTGRGRTSGTAQPMAKATTQRGDRDSMPTTGGKTSVGGPRRAKPPVRAF